MRNDDCFAVTGARSSRRTCEGGPGRLRRGLFPENPGCAYFSFKAKTEIGAVFVSGGGPGAQSLARRAFAAFANAENGLAEAGNISIDSITTRSIVKLKQEYQAAKWRLAHCSDAHPSPERLGVASLCGAGHLVVSFSVAERSLTTPDPEWDDTKPSGVFDRPSATEALRQTGRGVALLVLTVS